MINAIKIGIMLAVIIIMVYPLVPFGGKAKKFFPASGLRYDHPDNRKNLPFLILAFVEFIACVLLFTLLDKAVNFVKNIPFVGDLFSAIAKNLGSQIDFIFFTLSLVIVNLIILWAFVFAKLLLKKGVLDAVFGIYRKKRLEKKKERERKRRERRERRKNKKKSKNKGENTVEDNTTDTSEDETKDKKNLRVPGFFHSGFGDDEDKTDDDTKKDDPADETEEGEEEEKKPRYSPVAAFILGLFFEGEEYDIL